MLENINISKVSKNSSNSHIKWVFMVLSICLIEWIFTERKGNLIPLGFNSFNKDLYRIYIFVKELWIKTILYKEWELVGLSYLFLI